MLDKADITMPRGSAISGRIVDEFGEPLADAQVSAMRSTWVNGKRRLQSTGRMAQTNDLGQYRIYGLPPGEYFVSASTARRVRNHDGRSRRRHVRRLRRASGGRPGPVGIRAALRLRPHLLSRHAPTATKRRRSRSSVGQETQSTDFALIAGAARPRHRHGHRLRRPAVRRRDDQHDAAQRSPTSGTIMFPMGGSSRTDKNGSFTLNSVAPGDYTLQARGSRRHDRPTAATGWSSP